MLREGTHCIILSVLNEAISCLYRHGKERLVHAVFLEGAYRPNVEVKKIFRLDYDSEMYYPVGEVMNVNHKLYLRLTLINYLRKEDGAKSLQLSKEQKTEILTQVDEISYG